MWWWQYIMLLLLLFLLVAYVYCKSAYWKTKILVMLKMYWAFPLILFTNEMTFMISGYDQKASGSWHGFWPMRQTVWESCLSSLSWMCQIWGICWWWRHRGLSLMRTWAGPYSRSVLLIYIIIILHKSLVIKHRYISN